MPGAYPYVKLYSAECHVLSEALKVTCEDTMFQAVYSTTCPIS